MQGLETFKCLGQISPNPCHFWNNRSVFFQILHQSSGSGDITPLYFFVKIFYFKEPIKVQIWWIFMWADESLKFCTLMGSFCPNHIQFQLKSTEELSLIPQSSHPKFKEKLTFYLKNYMRYLMNFIGKCSGFEISM